MDGCSTAVQSKDSKDKDFRPKARPKDPDIARAAFRAQAKSAISKSHLRRLANNENAGRHDEIDSVFVGKSACFDPIKYDVDWIVESRMNKVADLFDVPPDGECGYDALQAALQDLLPPDGEVPDWLVRTPHGKYKLRQKIRQHFEDNLLLFLDLFDPILVNASEEAIPNLYVHKRDNYKRNLDRIIDCDYVNHYRGSGLPRRYWMQPEFVLPVVLHMLSRMSMCSSIFCYSPKPNNSEKQWQLGFDTQIRLPSIRGYV